MAGCQMRCRHQYHKMSETDKSTKTRKYPTLSFDHGDVYDLPEVMKIMGSSFSRKYGESWNHNQCRSMLCLPGTKLLLGRRASDLLGFAISRAVAGEEELLMIAVDPAVQEEGIGSLLLTELIERSRRENNDSLFLEVRENNPAQRLYIKLGFQQIGERKAYYTGKNGQKFDAHTFKLALN